MSSAAIRRLTPSEYLQRERASDSKHEFLDGYLVAMAGGSGNHGLIAGRVITALNNALATTFSAGTDQDGTNEPLTPQLDS